MQINFFEEYPTEENMKKLELVTWPATVLMAAESMDKFEEIRKVYSLQYPHITFGWWPTLPGSYWISGLANPEDLERIFSEILSKEQEIELPILLDLELPRSIHLYFKNIFHLGKNKKRINTFLQKAHKQNFKIYTAEYPAINKTMFSMWKILGISPAFDLSHTKLPMCYSSMIKKMYGNNNWQKIKKFEKQLIIKNPDKIEFGLGTIELGIQGNEPTLSPAGLVEDLKWIKETGAREVFIFRLGGLNAEYINAINSVN